MDFEEFEAKIKEVYEKSEADPFVDWPVVYDEDEDGLIFVNSEDGFIYFLGSNCVWYKSPLNIDKILKISFSKDYEVPFYEVDEDNEPDESSIFISFESGEIVWLHNWHESYEIDITVEFIKNDNNQAVIDEIVQNCTWKKEMCFSVRE